MRTAEKNHPVAMLNLLAFVEGKREQYKKYGAAFSQSVGARYGGNAKVVGRVLGGPAGEDGWDEIAVAHYPSIQHFAAMIGDKDYQEANQTFRLGSLKDTFIICTMEVDSDGELVKGGHGKTARL